VTKPRNAGSEEKKGIRSSSAGFEGEKLMDSNDLATPEEKKTGIERGS